jgi:hypothetical protein
MHRIAVRGPPRSKQRVHASEGARRGRSHSMLYAIVFATGFAGMLHAPWWAAVIGGCILALHLIAEDRRETLAYANGDAAAWEIAQTLSSLTIATVAAPIAFIAGQVSALLWGI